MKFRLLFFLMLLTSFTSISFANKKPKEYNAIVYSTDNIRYKGFIEKVSDNGITIDHLGKSRFIPAASINSIKVKRRNALTNSVLISSAGGLLAGSALYLYEQDKKTVNVSAIPVIVIGTALVSAGMGAIVNTFTSIEKYKHVNESGNFKKIQLDLMRYSGDHHSKK